jgi:hypothetical protein
MAEPEKLPTHLRVGCIIPDGTGTPCKWTRLYRVMLKNFDPKKNTAEQIGNYINHRMDECIMDFYKNHIEAVHPHEAKVFSESMSRMTTYLTIQGLSKIIVTEKETKE